MTAMATATAASKVNSLLRLAAYGAIAIVALMIALVFISLAGFYWLEEPLGPAAAAAIVAGILALLALIIFLWAFSKRKSNESGMMEQFGVPDVTEIVGSENVEAIQRNVQETIQKTRSKLRQVGPVKVTAAALAIGFLLGRMR